MSELQQAINEMRNMRESYDQIGTAAEAYNTGKAELAANINAKGVEASATETLPELAEKVAAISQETYEINGGETYAKQLFGSLETPNYWNLYDVLANLLSDGRLVQYGGILLAEYYRGYDSLALAGAGSGGAYVVSDKDGDGNFIMYTEDTTHTWATEFDGKGNRWVAYCFADEYHDFQITDTNTSPRSIFIGRKVGTITSLVNGRVSQIVVPDGNKLMEFNTIGKSQNFGAKVVLNVQKITAPQNGYLGSSLANTELVYINVQGDINVVYTGSLFQYEATALNSIIIRMQGGDFLSGSFAYSKTMGLVALIGCGVMTGRIGDRSNIDTVVLECDSINCQTNFGFIGSSTIIKKLYISASEFNTNNLSGTVDYMFLSYKDDDYTKSIYMTGGTVNHIIFANGYRKNINIAGVSNAYTAEEIALNILDRLGDNTGQSQLTLKIGATALATIQNSEEYSSYLTDAIDNKNWNVIA